jgi:hypothetical protein
MNDRAWEGFKTYAERHCVTVASLIDAIGEQLHDGIDVIDASVLEHASWIDKEHEAENTAS